MNKDLPVSSPPTIPDGMLYHVITHGKGMMGAYGMNIPVDDRWAIVAYVRAMQEARAVSPRRFGSERGGTVMGHRVTSADIPVNGEQLPKSKVQLGDACLRSSCLGRLAWQRKYSFWGFNERGTHNTWKGNYSFSWLFAVFYFFTIALGGCFWTLAPQRLQLGVGNIGSPSDGKRGICFPVHVHLRNSSSFPKCSELPLRVDD